MSIETIYDLEEVIKNEHLLEKYNMRKIGVFGSFARGEQANDIDFYVDTENYTLKNLLNLKKIWKK